MKNKIPNYISPFSFLFLEKMGLDELDTWSIFGLGDSFYWTYLRRSGCFCHHHEGFKKNTNIYATCLFLVTPLRTSLSAFNKDIAFVITVSVKQ